MTLLNGVAALQRATPTSTRVVVGRLAGRVVNLRPLFAWNGSNFARSYAASSQATIKSTKSTGAAKKTTTAAKNAKTSGQANKPKPKPKAKPTAKATAKTPAKRASRVASKVKPKLKPKPKVKSRARAVLTPQQKEEMAKKRQTLRERVLKRQRAEKKIERKRKLLEAALLDAPKLHEAPISSWNVFIAEKVGGTSGVPFSMSDLNKAYKELSPAEVKKLEATGVQRRADATAAYHKWVASHTPYQIKVANFARKKLKKEFGYPSSKSSVRLLTDPREPKRASSAYVMFVKSRWASGDVQGGVGDGSSARAVATQWKNMSDEEKKPFVDLYKADKERYDKEFTAVYNLSPSERRKLHM